MHVRSNSDTLSHNYASPMTPYCSAIVNLCDEGDLLATLLIVVSLTVIDMSYTYGTLLITTTLKGI